MNILDMPWYAGEPEEIECILKIEVTSHYVGETLL